MDRESDVTPEIKNNATRNVPPRRLLRRLLLIAACGIGAFFVLFAILIVPDQVRQIPEPRQDALFSVSSMLGDAKALCGNESVSPFVPCVEDRRNGESLSPVRPARVQIDPVLCEEYQKRLRPSLDPALIPEDKRALFKDMIREMDSLSSSLLALTLGPKTEGTDDDLQLLIDLRSAPEHIYDKFQVLFLDASSTWGIWETSWRKDWSRAWLKVSLDRGFWDDAAWASSILAGTPPDKESLWWETEIYCRRRLGMKGRREIARRSIQSIFYPFTTRLDQWTVEAGKRSKSVRSKQILP